MGKITSISLQKNHKDRINIFVDDEFFMGVSLELVYKFALKKDMEIDPKTLQDLIEENQKVEGLNKGIGYCSKNIKTESQVKKYLFDKQYPAKVVYYVLDKLKEYKYIDDEAFVKRYIESTSNRQGKRLSKYKLLQKGVKSDVVERVSCEVDVDSYSSARKIAEKYMKNKESTKENLAKTYRYLIGKGFSYEDVNKVISEFKVDE